ncbi:DUF3298 and DUF4163 domain-containing protein [Croceitalea sp. P059]|uniref:DUF3298 and DUF4163 domain-containing protein n=1 Tax=Croceitalea sp. P059 TaxID=3075601 RepID=UPI0028882156|nr:DUF3298 and DUF4163 domain-containing protein [Croceitalea sp. P059]MDT0538480.1 DUF3298 and DUF4163 domain-containing protein [Croceitalea sp. P059]
MRKIVLLIFLLVLNLCCETESKLTFENLQLENEKCDACPEIKIEIPHALDETRIAETINIALKEEIVNALKFEDSLDVNTIDGAMKSFTNSYQELRRKFNDETVGWEAEFNGEIIFENDRLISILLNSYSFTGGAHGYGATTLLNFDKQKGLELENHELFHDFEGFIAFTENNFRIKQNVPTETNINSTGFMFTNDTFQLPENIGFTENGIQLIYNQYEIASYADGPIELVLPFNEVNSFLKEGYVLITD